MKLKYMFFAALLGRAGSAFAATPAPGAASKAMMPHPGEKYCSEHAQECKDSAAKFDKWCAANADKCVAVKAWNEKRIEYCSAHEKECAEHMHKMHEHMKDWCAKNKDDEHCKKMKSHEDDMEGDTPPPK
jgi:hypothetical protein